MSKDYPALESLRARGYDAISIRRGLQSLLAGLCRPPGNLIVGLNDIRPFLRRLSDSQPVGFRRLVALVEGRDAERALPASIEAIDAFDRPMRCEVRAAGGADSAVNGTAALSATERRVVALWKEILQLDSIHAADNFFELGGNSLLLVRMGARVEQEFRKKIGAVEMFRYPTIGKLAGYLDETGSKTEQAGMESALERASARKLRMKKRLNPA
jgi:acyl carrier protein